MVQSSGAQRSVQLVDLTAGLQVCPWSDRAALLTVASLPHRLRADRRGTRARHGPQRRLIRRNFRHVLHVPADIRRDLSAGDSDVGGHRAGAGDAVDVASSPTNQPAAGAPRSAWL